MAIGTVDNQLIGLGWTIPRFSSLKDLSISTDWNLGRQEWQLRLYPHGKGSENEGFVSLYIYQVASEKVFVRYCLSITNMFNDSCYEFADAKTFSGGGNDLHGCPQFIRRSDLVAKGLLVGDVLKIKCTMDVGELPDQDGKMVEDTKDFQNNLGVIELKHVPFDCTVNVKSKVFQVHRFVLSKSDVFAAMFRHDMKETSSNVITIDDCDPAVFQEFLRFLYSNRLGNLTGTGYQELYACAHKYAIIGLKPLCEKAIRSKIMSIDNVIEILLFAEMYSLTALKNDALKFICKMPSKVGATSGWKDLFSNQGLMEEVLNSLASCITTDKLAEEIK